MSARVLIAGVGNVFHGDDGFGVAVARRLLEQPPPEGVRVLELGIRSFDLALALSDCAAAVIVDAVQRGQPPGTLVVLDPAGELAEPAPLEGHGLHPAQALRLAAELGGVPGVVRVVGCEPASLRPDPQLGLTPPVEAAVAPAAELALELARELVAGGEGARA